MDADERRIAEWVAKHYTGIVKREILDAEDRVFKKLLPMVSGLPRQIRDLTEGVGLLKAAEEWRALRIAVWGAIGALATCGAVFWSHPW